MGSKEANKEFLKLCQYGDREFSFNGIKPMPDDLNIEIHLGIESAVRHALNLNSKSDDDLLFAMEMNARSKVKPLEFSANHWDHYMQCLQNYRDHGAVYWHDWSVQNWGTKWDAYEVSVIDNCIEFQTAWGPVIELILTAGSKIEYLDLRYEFADEDIGYNCGYVSMIGADVKETTLEGGTKEAYEMAFSLWPERKEWYKLVDGEYVHSDD